MNAEIGYLSESASTMLSTILSLTGSSGGGGAGNDGEVGRQLEKILDMLPESFDELDIKEKAAPILDESGPEYGRAPYAIAVLQECERMNRLTNEMKRSLNSLKKGLAGELNMSQAMEDLAAALAIADVPGRDPYNSSKWHGLAWPSKKSLHMWLTDLMKRIDQLDAWQSEMKRPTCLWYSGLFNPMGLNTALMQATARASGQALDNMTTETYITTFKSFDDANYHPKDGCFLKGLYIEGARWKYDAETDETVDRDGTQCGGYLYDSKIKELLPLLPTVYLKAVTVDPKWDPKSVGYMRMKDDVYECPVYTTTFRGPTYIFLSTLTVGPKPDSKDKWILAGVAIILQSDD